MAWKVSGESHFLNLNAIDLVVSVNKDAAAWIVFVGDHEEAAHGEAKDLASAKAAASAAARALLTEDLAGLNDSET